MSILVEKSGILSIVQDTGRIGFRRFGINSNGVMDEQAARLINVLLGNDENGAIVEMHFPAPQLLFEKDAVIALGGADFGAKLCGESIENWRPVFVDKNQVLSFTEKRAGNRVYFAVKGGFRVEKWLGSAATNLVAGVGGFHGRSLQKNDRLFFNSRVQRPNSKFRYRISENLIPPCNSLPRVRVITGAEFETLTAESKAIFESQNFAIRSNSNRMGFRLCGDYLKLKKNLELISSAVAFGTIQLLPDGQMIVLMADHQTSGGYPRIAHVISTDLPILAQLGAGDKVNFQIVSLRDAERSMFEFRRDLNLLRIGVNSKYEFER